MIKKTFTINEKNKDLGFLKKVRKQEKLRGDFWFWKLFWESWELFSARHEHSISVPDSTSLNHCITDKTLQRLFIHVSSLIKALVSILLVPKGRCLHLGGPYPRGWSVVPIYLVWRQ